MKQFRLFSGEDVVCTSVHPARYYTRIFIHKDWMLNKIKIINQYESHPVLEILSIEMNLVNINHCFLVNQ